MTGFKEFAVELKKHFNIRKDNVSKPYEITYVKLTGLENNLVVNINSDRLTLEMKKYSFSAPDKKPVSFYRVVAQFQKKHLLQFITKAFV